MNELLADSLGMAIACFGTGCAAVGFLFGALLHPGWSGDERPSAIPVPGAPGVWDSRARRRPRQIPWWLRPSIPDANPAAAARHATPPTADGQGRVAHRAAA